MKPLFKNKYFYIVLAIALLVAAYQVLNYGPANIRDFLLQPFYASTNVQNARFLVVSDRDSKLQLVDMVNGEQTYTLIDYYIPPRTRHDPSAYFQSGIIVGDYVYYVLNSDPNLYLNRYSIQTGEKTLVDTIDSVGVVDTTSNDQVFVKLFFVPEQSKLLLYYYKKVKVYDLAGGTVEEFAIWEKVIDGGGPSWVLSYIPKTKLY